MKHRTLPFAVSAALPVALMLALSELSGVASLTGLSRVAYAQTLPDFADLVEKVGPAVVNIRTLEKSKMNGSTFGSLDENDPMAELFNRFFGQRGFPGMPGFPNTPNNPNRPPNPKEKNQRGQPPEEVQRGVGSGFVVSADGYILTNHHVVDGADTIYVTLTDKREFKAKLVGSDRRTDIALLKIDSSGLSKMNIGDPNKSRVGEWVLAIGSPFGLDNSVSSGIISAKSRDIGDYLPFIQTDVAVNPGNSGGPLINMKGEVIGVNSQILTRSGGYQGISLAIPIDEAMRVVEQLKTTGKVTRGRIGVSIDTVTREVAEALNLPKAQGAQITAVESGSPAEKAGLQAGDIILKFEGKPIEKSSDLPRLVGNTKLNSKAMITIWRQGKTQDIAVTIGEMPAEKLVAKTNADKKSVQPNDNPLGLMVVELPEDRKKELKIKAGVMIEVAEGWSARAGLQQGDIVLSMNNTELLNPKQFYELAHKVDVKRPIALLVRRGETTQFVVLRPQNNK
jgi:serine protease Do